MQQLAIEVFCYRVAKYVGSYVAAMNGVDAIAFTAGIGENVRLVREKYLQHTWVTLASLWMQEANAKSGDDMRDLCCRLQSKSIA